MGSPRRRSPGQRPLTGNSVATLTDSPLAGQRSPMKVRLRRQTGSNVLACGHQTAGKNVPTLRDSRTPTLTLTPSARARALRACTGSTGWGHPRLTRAVPAGSPTNPFRAQFAPCAQSALCAESAGMPGKASCPPLTALYALTPFRALRKNRAINGSRSPAGALLGLRDRGGPLCQQFLQCRLDVVRRNVALGRHGCRCGRYSARPSTEPGPGELASCEHTSVAGHKHSTASASGDSCLDLRRAPGPGTASRLRRQSPVRSGQRTLAISPPSACWAREVMPKQKNRS